MRARTHKPEEISWQYLGNTKKKQPAAGEQYERGYQFLDNLFFELT